MPRPIRVTAITSRAVLFAVSLGAAAAPAAACSLRAPWGLRDGSSVPFLATAMPDTLPAGAGTMRVTVQMGHFGRGVPRAIHGQRVRIDSLGARGRRTVGDATHAVLVPWDYGADCSPVTWGRSARWIAPGTQGLFTAALRPREHWVDGLPTFDIIGTQFQPYPQARAGFGRFVEAGTPLLPAGELLHLLDSVPPRFPLEDTLATRRVLAALLADTARARAYPVAEMIREAAYALAEGRVRLMRAPIPGTFALEVAIGDAPWRPLFVRTMARPMSLIGDTLPPRARASPFDDQPFIGFEVYAAAAPTRAALPGDCRWEGGEHTLAYLGVETDGRPLGRSFRGTFDARLLDAVLTPAEVAARDSLRRADLERMRRGERPIDWPGPGPYRPRWNLRWTAGPGDALRVSGEFTLLPHGRIRVRGHRVDAAVLGCF